MREVLLTQAGPALHPPSVGRGAGWAYLHADSEEARLASLAKLLARAQSPDFVALVRPP